MANPTASKLSIGRWLEPFVVHPSIKAALPDYHEYYWNIQHPRVDQDSIIWDSLCKAYEVDGEDFSTQKSIDSEVVRNGRGVTNPVLQVVQMLLGLPSRKGDTWRQAVRNMFGGWTPIRRVRAKEESYSPLVASSVNYDEDVSDFSTDSTATPASSKVKYRLNLDGKRLWNLLLLPVKLVIFAVKLVTLPLKFALNIVKLASEVLPEVLVNLTGKGIGYFVGKCMEALELYQKKNSRGQREASLGELLAAWFVLGIPMVLLGALHYAARVWQFLGAALTSPEKSARMAWSYGQAIKYRPLAYFFSILGAAISVTITAILWAITLPLVFSGAVALFPSLGSVITSLSQLPIIASTLAYINGAAVFVSGTLPAAFSAGATAISMLFGMAVSAETLAVAAVFAFIVAPVGSILSRIADGLSNTWANWKSETTLSTAFKEGRAALASAAPVLGGNGPSSKAKKLVSARRSLEETEIPLYNPETDLRRLPEPQVKEASTGRGANRPGSVYGTQEIDELASDLGSTLPTSYGYGGDATEY